MSNKLNMADIANKIQKKFEKEKKPSLANKIGVGSNLSKLEDKDFIRLPDWWKEVTGVIGLPFGKLIMIAGDSDSGKTSIAITAMKAAQAQGCGVIYVETEGKTTEEDLVNWGVNPDNILLIQASIAEEAFQLLFDSWDMFVEQNPNTPLLIVYDSIGNQVSLRDTEIDLIEANSKPGGKGSLNRLAINKMIAKRDKTNAAILVSNYTYDNIGSPGKTNAGGKAVNFFSCLTFQTSRKGWIEKTKNGRKIRAGAKVLWKVFKNHLKKNHGVKEVVLDITQDGMSLASENEF